MPRKIEHDARHTAIKKALVEAMREQGIKVELIDGVADYEDVFVGEGDETYNFDEIADRILEAELAL